CVSVVDILARKKALRRTPFSVAPASFIPATLSVVVCPVSISLAVNPLAFVLLAILVVRPHPVKLFDTRRLNYLFSCPRGLSKWKSHLAPHPLAFVHGAGQEGILERA